MKPTEPDVLGLLQRGYRFALALTHDAHEADDLIQEAWIGLLRARGPFTAGYLFTCIRSRFIDACRRGRATGPTRLDDEHEPAAAETEDDWGTAVALTDGSLHNALAALQPEERVSLYLAAVEGYSAQAIADLFGWPRGTVLSHMHRARAKLRRNLEHPCERTE